MKTIIALLLASCVVSLAQINSNNFDLPSGKDASFESTAQMMNALQYGGSVEAIKLLIEKGANLRQLEGSAAVLSNGLQSFNQSEVIPPSPSQAAVNVEVASGTNTDSSGYVTNVALLTPLTLTNSAGDVFTNAILYKLFPNKFIWKTPDGAMGTARLDSLPQKLLDEIGYDPARATQADAIEQETKQRQQEVYAQQRQQTAEQSELQVSQELTDANISSAIKAYAEKKWPGDYEMQKYEIDKQTDAYNWVVAATSSTGVPQDVFDQIKSAAVDKWPDEYGTS